MTRNPTLVKALRGALQGRRSVKIAYCPTPYATAKKDYLCIIQGVDPRDCTVYAGNVREWQAWADTPENALRAAYQNFLNDQHGVPQTDA